MRIELLDWTAACERAARIRITVFVDEQRVPLEEEMDADDARSEHALAIAASGAPVGTGRLLPDGRIGRMAVLRQWRGRGAGAAILSALIERARVRGFREVTLHAQTHAVGFYAKSGFVPFGTEFIEAGIAHVAMRLRLE